MKTFLRISFIALALALTTTANAQLLPISIGLKGGITRSDISNSGTDGRNGFNAGATVDINLPANFGIFSGLEVITKGAKLKESGIKISPMYLQLPVRLGYRLKLLPGLRAHFGFGPYFAQGIGGKIKGEFAGAKIDEKIFDDAFQKFDWGLGAEVGVTVIGRIQVRTGYDFGMKSASRPTIGQLGDKMKNRSFYLSAGLIIL